MNSIENKVLKVLESSNFPPQNAQSKEKTSTLLVTECLNKINLVIRELIKQFESISRQTTVDRKDDLRLLIDGKIGELKCKSSDAVKLSFWYEKNNDNLKQKMIVLNQIESIFIQMHTIMILLRSKIDYSGRLMLSEYQFSIEHSKRLSTTSLISSSYQTLVTILRKLPVIGTFVVGPMKDFIALALMVLLYSNHKSILCAKIEPEKKIETKNCFVDLESDSFEVIDSIDQIKTNLQEMNQLAERYKQLIDVMSDLVRWIRDDVDLD